jgi:hypothetical protein
MVSRITITVEFLSPIRCALSPARAFAVAISGSMDLWLWTFFMLMALHFLLPSLGEIIFGEGFISRLATI